MRILYVTHYSEMYGANLALLQLIKEVINRDNDIKVWVLVPSRGGFTIQLDQLNIEYIVCKFYNWLAFPDWWIKSKIKLFFNFFIFRFLLGKIRNLNLDLIHTNSSATNIGSFLSRKLRLPHVWHIREFGMEDFGLKYFYRFDHIAKVVSESAYVIVISKVMYDKYSKYIQGDNLKLVYDGLYFPPLNVKNFNLDYTKPLQLCIIGRITANKNQIEAIRVIIYLNTLRNRKFVLNIVGSGFPEYIDELKRYIKDGGVEDQIMFHGYMDDIHNFLLGMDVGIICSRFEAFGRVTVEYMYNRLVVVGSSSGATSELIGSNDKGYLYQLGDIEDFASKLLHIEKNRFILPEVGNRASEYATTKFSSELNTKTIFDLYRNLLSIK